MLRCLFITSILLSSFIPLSFATETTVDVGQAVKFRGGSSSSTNYNSLGLRVKDAADDTFSRGSALDFDLSGISASDTCDSAVLKITPDTTNGSSATFNVWENLRTDWSEGSATWDDYKTSTPWTTGGARSDGNDINGDWTGTTGRLAYYTGTSTADSQISFTDVDFCTYLEPLFGSGTARIIIHATQSENQDLRFYDDEDATASNRPDLVITHSAAGGGSSGYSGAILIRKRK